MKKLLIFLVVGGVAIYGLIAVLRGPARSFTEALLEGAVDKTALQTGNAYLSDADRDGLSDAKEAIYGTDPEESDSDNDGFGDGEEVFNGFDPTRPGEAKILDNEALAANLTIQYFEWAREISGSRDPQLNDEAVQQFLETRGFTQATLPTIDAADINAVANDSDDAAWTYFSTLAGVQLPASTASFIDLADEVVREQQSDVLDDVILGLEETYALMTLIPTPPRLIEVHRGQLALLKALRNLFVDLYSIDNDPVLLVRDINWGNDLLLRSVALEQERRSIAAALPSPETGE